MKADAYAEALVQVARAEGQLGAVEDDLFRLARTYEGSDELRMALSDPQLPVERRIAVIEELMGNKALGTSTALASMLVAAGQSSDLPAIIDRFVELAAAERQHEVAEVRTAIPLDEAQTQRLAEALGKATGKNVEVKVVVDPSVLGGIVARVGDTVIDGSIRHRLDQLKELI
ncbi:MAG: ATP synthase F1 subunit delta [Actinobacteria bacterium]|nr:ATP synthase F1 subunit delta [Actinomycetota bacterium]